VADNAGKTEKPTPRRIKKARKDGQFPRTPDAAAWLGILAAAALMPKSAQLAGDRFRELLAMLPEVAHDPTPERALKVLSNVPVDVLVSCAPVCLAAAAGALLAQASQGVHVSGKALKPKFSRLSPKQGIKRMFGVRAAWEALKSLIKVIVIAVVVVAMGRDLIPQLAASGTLPLAATVARAHDGMQTILYSAAVAGLLLALFDYAYQRRSVMKQLRMSIREIKDEVKQTEGDPMIKGAIRARQLAISRNRMLSAVVDADVVLVNPTHIAVALKYRPGMGAPRVVAKGAGAIAAKIRERAYQHQVPVVEDKPLARTLYRICELEDEVPAELYVVVAKILAFVMAAGKPGRPTAGRGSPGRDAPGRGTPPPPRKPRGESDIPDLPTKSQLRARRAQELRDARR
jgi:flagellar biosynthesis protein FlhB